KTGPFATSRGGKFPDACSYSAILPSRRATNSSLESTPRCPKVSPKRGASRIVPVRIRRPCAKPGMLSNKSVGPLRRQFSSVMIPISRLGSAPETRLRFPKRSTSWSQERRSCMDFSRGQSRRITDPLWSVNATFTRHESLRTFPKTQTILTMRDDGRGSQGQFFAEEMGRSKAVHGGVQRGDLPLDAIQRDRHQHF